jgi:hypothetical protein
MSLIGEDYKVKRRRRNRRGEREEKEREIGITQYFTKLLNFGIRKYLDCTKK